MEATNGQGYLEVSAVAIVLVEQKKANGERSHSRKASKRKSLAFFCGSGRGGKSGSKFAWKTEMLKFCAMT